MCWLKKWLLRLLKSKNVALCWIRLPLNIADDLFMYLPTRDSYIKRRVRLFIQHTFIPLTTHYIIRFSEKIKENVYYRNNIEHCKILPYATIKSIDVNQKQILKLSIRRKTSNKRFPLKIYLYIRIKKCQFLDVISKTTDLITMNYLYALHTPRKFFYNYKKSLRNIFIFKSKSLSEMSFSLF